MWYIRAWNGNTGLESLLHNPTNKWLKSKRFREQQVATIVQVISTCDRYIRVKCRRNSNLEHLCRAEGGQESGGICIGRPVGIWKKQIR